MFTWFSRLLARPSVPLHQGEGGDCPCSSSPFPFWGGIKGGGCCRRYRGCRHPLSAALIEGRCRRTLGQSRGPTTLMVWHRANRFKACSARDGVAGLAVCPAGADEAAGFLGCAFLVGERLDAGDAFRRVGRAGFSVELSDAFEHVVEPGRGEEVVTLRPVRLAHDQYGVGCGLEAFGKTAFNAAPSTWLQNWRRPEVIDSTKDC